MYEQAKQNRRFSIQKLSTYFSFFGIVPWYNLQEQRIVHVKLYKYYAILLTISLEFFSLVVLYVRLILTPKEDVIEQILCVTMQLIVMVSFAIIVLGSAFWNMGTWENFLDQIIHIQNFGNFSKPYPTRNGNIIFVLGNLFLFGLYFGQLLVFDNKSAFFLYFSCVYLLLYNQLLTVIVIIDGTQSLRFEYQRLNDMVKCLRFGEMSSVKTLREIKRSLITLGNTVDDFNKLFGWPLLLILFNGVVNILEGLAMGISRNLEWFGKEHAMQKKVMLNVVYIVGSM
ncbi:uncharacterized protein LOC108916120, partial [Anoplophora glabripennis]|uniref:uncharacterized protein LOC108916120 n=1 Tax=Anoplophora glabripennis TaxID=217634 RepID=UPI0008753F34